MLENKNNNNNSENTKSTKSSKNTRNAKIIKTSQVLPHKEVHLNSKGSNNVYFESNIWVALKSIFYSGPV